MIARLDAAIALAETDRPAAATAIGGIARDVAQADAATRDHFVVALAERLGHDHPGLAAQLALIGGALVETGANPGPLGPAMLAPLGRALVAAQRFVELAKDLPDEPECKVAVGGKQLSAATIDVLAQKDLEAVRAFLSLELWYRPAVALWSLEPQVLKRAQAELGETATALHASCTGAHWIALLLEVCVELPFVVLIPDLHEAWELVLDGCSDNSQFLTLLSEALRDPLRCLRLAPAPEPVLAIARGEGPQQADGYYSARFHLYPWQAIDPSSGRPVDGRFQWLAPGGYGTQFLPGDYPPSRITPLEGRRVVALVPSSFSRVITNSRMFAPLRAGISKVRRLDPTEAKTWTDPVAPRFFEGSSRPWWQFWKRDPAS